VAVVRHRVPGVQESNASAAMAAPGSSTVIERIEIKPVVPSR
jgi:hypothetical protein